MKSADKYRVTRHLKSGNPGAPMRESTLSDSGGPMKLGSLFAVLAALVGLSAPVFGQPRPISPPLENGGVNVGHAQAAGPSKPTHPGVVRHKGHKGTKHKNPHKRVQH